MRKATYSATFLVLLYALVLTGCGKPDYSYSTDGIYLKNYDNSGSYYVESSDSISGSAYIIRMYYTSTLSDFYSVNDDYTYEALNKPTSIEIRCLQNFDSLHPANTLLNEYFINGPGPSASLDDVIISFPDTKDFYPTHDPDDLWLMKAPEIIGTYSFVVKMVFDDGVIASDTTTVKLKL